MDKDLSKTNSQPEMGRSNRPASPSSYSTASSGSPLVRNGSSTSSQKSFAFSISSNSLDSAETKSTNSQGSNNNGSGRRPAPTSIAAAQLTQLEQQSKQATCSTTKSTKRQVQNGNKLAHILLATKQQQHQQQPVQRNDYYCQSSNQRQLSSSEANNNDNNNNKNKMSAKPTVEKLSGAKPHQEHPQMNGKSFGYNLGKSMAYRANRFNEFWSANKMRYLNLACLLMTLVCLLTILLFSKTSLINNNNSNSASDWQASSQERFAKSLVGGGRRQSAADQPESMDSLGKQALVSPDSSSSSSSSSSANVDDEEDQASSASNNENSDEEAVSTTAFPPSSTDGFNLFDEHQPASPSSSSKRDLSALADREVEDNSVGQTGRPFSNMLLDDLDDMGPGFGLFKTIRQQLLSNANNSHNQVHSSMFKPIIRRGKNGATIIIGGTTTLTGNDSALIGADPLMKSAASSMMMPSSFFERFLAGMPPSPLSGPFSSISSNSLSASPVTTIRRSFQGPGNFGATITIRQQASEPSLLRANSLFGLDSAASSDVDEIANPWRRLPGHFGSPPAMIVASSQPMHPPLGLLNAILRAAMPPQQPSMLGDLDKMFPLASVTNNTGNNSTSHSYNDQNSTAALTEAISTQASNQQPVSLSKQQPVSESMVNNSNPTSNETSTNLSRSINSTASNKEASASRDVELFDVSHLPRALPFGGQSPGSGGMIIISSGGGLDPSMLESRRTQLLMNGASASPFSAFGSNGHFLTMPRRILTPFETSGMSFPAQQPTPFSPILRAILGNVMSDLSANTEADSQDSNSSKLHEQGPARRGDDQTSEMTTADEWDEQQPMSAPGQLLSQASQRMPRHRSANLEEDNLGEQQGPAAVEQPPGSLIEQILQSAFDESPARVSIGLGHPFMSPHLNMAQQHRRRQQPSATGSVTIERIIGGLPQPMLVGGLQQVGPGIRSQSISRSQLDEQQDQASESSGPSHLTAMNRRIDSDSKDIESPLSLGPIFASPSPFIVRRGRQMLLGGPVQMQADQRRDLEMNDDSSADDDEQSASPADNLPQSPRRGFRVSRVRLVGRQRRPETLDHLFMPASPQQDNSHPTRRSSSAEDDDGQASEQNEDQQLKRSLNQAISVAAAAAAAASGVAAGHPESSNHQPPIKQSTVQPEFTSPTSPLFGFPSRSAATNHQQRPPRPAFVYHSNHEVAKPFSAAQARSAKDDSPSIHHQHSPLPPPAAIVMGRRLDDGPFSSLSDTNYQQAQKASPDTASFSSMGNARQLQQPISLTGRDSSLAETSHKHLSEHSASIINNNNTFRTIIV